MVHNESIIPPARHNHSISYHRHIRHHLLRLRLSLAAEQDGVECLMKAQTFTVVRARAGQHSIGVCRLNREQDATA